MDNDNRVLNSVLSIQTDVSEIKLQVSVLATKQDGIVNKLERGVGRLDDHGGRLCSIESTQERHASFFSVLGAGITTCVGVVIAFFQWK